MLFARLRRPFVWARENPAVALSVAATIAAMGFGVAPRIGPGCACGLFLGSLFDAPEFVSLRPEVKTIKAHLQSQEEWDQCFDVVSGPKGIGKSLAVDTATMRTPGVVRVTLAQGLS